MGKYQIVINVLSLICCSILFSPALYAQNEPFLVKDINAITNQNPSSAPFAFAAIGSVAYFIAYDPIHDRELWRSDGTAAGTWLLKDLNPGAGFSWIGSSDLINVNGTLFFAAFDPARGIELWRSDGTTSGTTVVKDIFPGLESSYPGELRNINNILYFTATTPSCGIGIWKSDGSEGGTTLVFCGIYVQQLTQVNNTLFFANFDNDHGFELWKMDLDTEISTLVKDIFPGTESSNPCQIRNANGTLFFIARQENTGKELWKSDGTAEGTVLVKDIFPGPEDSMACYSAITDANGMVFFGADDGINGIELWKSDGTESGTNLLKDIYGGPLGSRPRGINLNGTYIFVAEDYDNRGIWRSDGTPNGTYKLTGRYDYYEYNLAKVGNVACFSTSFNYPMTLWKTDGTRAGTTVVAYVQNISKGSFGDVSGTLFFGGDDGTTGHELWKSDGTVSGTVFIKDLNPSATDTSWINLSASLHNELFFSAIDGIHGRELWKSNGTEAGTILLKDIYPGTGHSIELDSIPDRDMAEVNGLLLFRANDGVKGHELWKTDGTAAGTTLIKDIWRGDWGSWPHALTTVGNQIYFLASRNFKINQLWKTDGTTENTVLIRNLKTYYSRNAQIVELNGAVVFTTDDEGEGIWRSDGTRNGTYLLRKMEFGARELTNVNGTIFFSGTEDNLTGSELWKTDGTIAGTVLVKDINPGYGYSDPTNLTNGNGTLYFVACDSEHGCELWRSGGTFSSTFLVKDIYPGSESSWPSNLEYVNGFLLFSASDGVHGIELWKSDGTEAGTTIAADIATGPSSSTPQFITADVNGKAVLAAADDSVDLEPWITDAFSTTLLGDVNFGYAASNPAQFFRSGNLLYFEANDGLHGPELWATSLPASPDFKLVCSPALVTGSRRSDCKVISLNNFNDPVTLSCTNLPAGLSCNFDLTTVTPPPNGSVITTLTIDVDPSMIYNTYSFKVNANGNGITRTADIWIVVMPDGALFFDDFEDGDISDWNKYYDDHWSVTNGNLNGSTQTKSEIFAPFSGCSTCEIEFDVQLSTFGKVSLLAWWQNKSNGTELSFQPDKNKIVLTQRAEANVVATKSISFPIQLGQTYRVNIKFENKSFKVSIDGNEIIQLPSSVKPFGTVGFRLKSIEKAEVNASFERVLIR